MEVREQHHIDSRPLLGSGSRSDPSEQSVVGAEQRVGDQADSGQVEDHGRVAQPGDDRDVVRRSVGHAVPPYRRARSYSWRSKVTRSPSTPPGPTRPFTAVDVMPLRRQPCLACSLSTSCSASGRSPGLSAGGGDHHARGPRRTQWSRGETVDVLDPPRLQVSPRSAEPSDECLLLEPVVLRL